PVSLPRPGSGSRPLRTSRGTGEAACATGGKCKVPPSPTDMTAPRLPLFDAHFHVIDYRYPLAPNQGYLPPEFRCEDYEKIAGDLEVAGGALVSGSYHGFDRTLMLDALRRLGPSFVGVVQLAPTASDEEVIELDRAGVRGVRFNIERGGSAGLNDLES